MSTDQTHQNKASNVTIENDIVKCIDKFSDGLKDKSYGELLLEYMSANPSFVAQVDAITGKEITFSTMLEKTIKCSMWLKQRNIQPGDIIAISTYNHIDMYVPCFASMCVGAVFNVWWDRGLSKDTAKYFIESTKPKFLFANEASVKIVQEILEEMNVQIEIVVFESLSGFQSLEEILSSQDEKLVPEFRCTKLSSPEEPAVILYTSGSTGLPKCAVFSHKSLHANALLFGRYKVTKHYSTSMNLASLSWLSGLYTLCQDVMLQRTRIVHPGLTAEIFFQLIEKYKVSWTFMAVRMGISFSKSPARTNYDLSSVEYLLMGGSPMMEKTQNSIAEMFPNANLYQSYGSTEIGNTIVQQTDYSKSGSCGTLTFDASMKIVDLETGQILGPNQYGEACFKSPHMMSCYYKNPEETKKVIDFEGWIHTGDLLHYDEDGNVFFFERIEELIKYRTCQISPSLIESVLLGHPGVKEAAVVGMPHDIDGEHPIAFVTKMPNAQVTEEDLKQLVSDSLPDHMKLRGGVRFLDEIPATNSGKLARAVLRKWARSFAH